MRGTGRILPSVMTTTKKKRVEITLFEYERVVRQSVSALCPICRIDTEMLTPQQAGDFAGVDVQSIYQRLAEGRAHSAWLTSGERRVCRNSLLA